MYNQIGTSIAVLIAIAFGGASSSHAARLCKDGYVTYTGSAPAFSRPAAEANAIRAWRRATIGLLKNRTPNTSVRCVQDKGAATWRCFVRAGRCSLA
jgi:hypothetical protein